jgi:hypothetical protein
VLSSKGTVFLKHSIMILHHTWHLSRSHLVCFLNWEAEQHGGVMIFEAAVCRLQVPWVWLSMPDLISDWIFL